MQNTAPYKCFLSFADSRMAYARQRIEKQAEKMNLFDEIRVWDESNLDEEFKQKWKDVLRTDVRGFGYWVWKPYIILKTLESMPEGGILLYLDVGCHLNPLARKRLLKYFATAYKDNLGVKAFPVNIWNVTKSLEKSWTKGDVFDHFSCRESKKITDSFQIEPGHIFIYKCKNTIDLVKEWYRTYEENFTLIDDTPSQSHNFSSFREHRHDQSIFSILFKLNGGSPLPQGGTIPYILTNPFWSLRDKWEKQPSFKQKVKDIIFYHAKYICFKLRTLVSRLIHFP